MYGIRSWAAQLLGLPTDFVEPLQPLGQSVIVEKKAQHDKSNNMKLKSAGNSRGSPDIPVARSTKGEGADVATEAEKLKR